jgi:hypothetical protein
MGHTVASQRQVVDTILSELRDYRKSLRHDELAAFDSALDKVKKHIGSISFACSYNTWALVLFSIILEQEKEMMKDK